MIKPRNTGAFGIPTGIHYAWIVMLIAAVMHMVGGSIRQAFGVLIVPLEEANAWNPAMVPWPMPWPASPERFWHQ